MALIGSLSEQKTASVPQGTVAPSAPAATDVVKDVTAATFRTEVLEASMQALVLVDFWAPWCGPCKQLGPILEKVVRSYAGAVRLAKMDADRHPQFLQQLRVQSIPAVFAFFRGQPVDGFMGALPEQQIRAWVDQLVKAAGVSGPSSAGPSPEEVAAALRQAAEDLLAGRVAEAEDLYRHIFAVVPDNAEALAGLARAMIAGGKLEEARTLLASSPAPLATNPLVRGAHVALALAEETAPFKGREATLEARLQRDPADHAARFDVALAYYAAGRREDATEALLEVVRRDRAWQEGAARQKLLTFFEAFGPGDPLTVQARKRLSSLLFS